MSHFVILLSIIKGGIIIVTFIKNNIKGIILCLIIAIPSYFLGTVVPIVGGPVFAIIIGMVLTLLIKEKSSFHRV